MQVFDLPDQDAQPRLVAFSPDGRFLAAWANGRVFVIDTGTGAVRRVWDEPDSGRAEGSGLAFTADSGYVVARHASADRAVIAVHNRETGAVVNALTLHSLNDGFVPAADNRTMFVAVHPTPDRATAEFVRWNPLTGEQSEPFARHRNVVRQLAVSADARWLAGTFGDELRLWCLGGESPPQRSAAKIPFGPDFVMSLALSADGAFVAAGAYEGAVQVIDARRREAHPVGTRPNGAARDLAFHPSRSVLAFSATSEEVVFYDAAARTDLKCYAWDVGRVTATAFSPDGLRCAAAAAGKVVIWDVDV